MTVCAEPAEAVVVLKKEETHTKNGFAREKKNPVSRSPLPVHWVLWTQRQVLHYGKVVRGVPEML